MRSQYWLWEFFSGMGVLLLFCLNQTVCVAGGEPIDSVDCDVVVVGAGSAGIPAAVQAARAGATTILLENGFQPGGTATSGGVNFPGLFHAWGKQVIAGVGWEWVTTTVNLNGGELPDFSIPAGDSHWEHQILVNIATYAVVAEDLCLKAGVDIRYYESPWQVTKLAADSEIAKEHGGAHWQMISISQGESREIFCKEMVDCTGNGQLCALAGAERMREDETQPGTFNFQLISGLDLTVIDQDLVKQRYKEALDSGELKETDVLSLFIPFLDSKMGNYIFGADNSTGQRRTATNIEARQSMLRILRFILTLPSGDKAHIVSMSPEVGVRETYRVHCVYDITQEDYTSGRIWEDSLAYAFYPIDLHRNETGVRPVHLQEGIVATIPLRAMLPAKVDHLLVAGRCIGSDRMANSALRVQATCMASGQAAGAVAAYAALSRTTPSSVELDKVKELLHNNGAIVP